MKIVFQMSCLTLFQECQPIPLTGFQSTAGGDVLNFDELMHKDCRNSWKCKKNKITVRHEGVFLGCRKIQILSAADLQEVWVYSKAQARWKMVPKNHLLLSFTKKYVVENNIHYMVCSLHFEFCVVEEK